MEQVAVSRVKSRERLHQVDVFSYIICFFMINTHKDNKENRMLEFGIIMVHLSGWL